MDYEISPEPSEAERAAIVAALAEEDEQPAVSPWGEAGLPGGSLPPLRSRFRAATPAELE